MHAALFLVLGCCSASLGVFAPQPLSPDWSVRSGDWRVLDASPVVVWQSSDSGPAQVVLPEYNAPGSAWRCVVEPGPNTEAVGFYFGASPDLKQGYLLMTGGPAGRGVALTDASGTMIWQDRFAVSSYYTPVVLEAVLEPGRVRVQAFQWNRETLVAQSDWIPVQDVGADERRTFALFTNNGAARFWKWEHAEQPLSDIVPDSPSKLRLVSEDASAWIVSGDGDWRWISLEKTVLRQAAAVERTRVIAADDDGPEGHWRTRIAVEKGAGGAGLLFLTDQTFQHGFSAWLGGEFGNGALMLYRFPGNALWSSDQGKWQYDTEYVLEGIVAGGKVQVRMLAGDAKTVIAESPAFDLTDQEKVQPGRMGLETWKGMARFSQFNEKNQAPIENLPVLVSSPLGAGWRVFSGKWDWADKAHDVLWQLDETGPAAALNVETQAAKGIYSVKLLPGKGLAAVDLLFQASADLKEGFVCRLSQGVSLLALSGKVLWQKPDFAWESGKIYQLEASVIPDRVRIRVLDESGQAIIQSEDCYVSDLNNTRKGYIGFRTEGGAVQFTQWSIRPAE